MYLHPNRKSVTSTEQKPNPFSPTLPFQAGTPTLSSGTVSVSFSLWGSSASKVSSFPE